MLCEAELCTGCAACHNICPKHSIQMLQNKTGFWVPQINSETCIFCKECARVCPVLHKTEPAEIVAAYSGYSKSSDVLRCSSSGGIFSVLSEWVLKQGGVVFGTAFDGGNYSVSCRGTDDTTLACLCKSKYIESETAGVYQKVCLALQNGRYALFCSTPCKISAMINYAVMRGVSREKLILVDFVCHGIGSSFIWKNYLQSKEKQHGSQCESADFRCKKYGWDFSNVLKLTFQNGKEYYGDLIGDPWYRLYVKRIGLRPSCYVCDALKHSAADITCADFLGASLAQREAHSGGLSLILARSAQGRELLKIISNEMVFQSVRPEEYQYIFEVQDYGKAKSASRQLFQNFLSDGFSIGDFAKRHGGTNALRGKLMRNRMVRRFANTAYRLKGKGKT